MTTILLLLISVPNAQPDIQPDEFQRWVEETFDPPAETKEPAAPSVPSVPSYSASQMEVVRLTNQFRASRGLKPLLVSPVLMNSAQKVVNYHASTGRFGHSNRSSRPNASENIAWNSSRSTSQLVTQWINSSGHRSNMLGSWTYIGTGVSYSSSRILGAQHFSNNPTPSGSAITLQGRSTRNRSTVSKSRSGPLRRLLSRRR